MVAGLIRRLTLARNRLRDYCEELIPHVILPRLTRSQVYARFGIQRCVWDEFEPAFGTEVGIATRADAEFLFSFLEKQQPARFLEIGTWRGGTAALIKTVCPQTEVVTLNYPEPDLTNNPLQKAEVGRAFQRRNLDVKLVWADSADLPRMNLGRFDAIFVDGDHKFKAALGDLENAWAILQTGGYLLFHDFVQEFATERQPHCRRVVRAFRRFARNHREEIAEGFCMEQSWIGVVRKRFEHS